MVLTKMKETAEAYLGTKVTHAVVTVPACESELLSTLIRHRVQKWRNTDEERST
jgi:molecular chaperone DnaK (HSP70)